VTTLGRGRSHANASDVDPFARVVSGHVDRPALVHRRARPSAIPDAPGPRRGRAGVTIGPD
jgi:hypothetical protein